MERSLIAEYQLKHRISRYGTTGIKVLPHVVTHALALRPSSLIDYGCGQSMLAPVLADAIGATSVLRYDPAIPFLSRLPEQRFELLTCIDVLEHVPDEEIDAVASEMASCCVNAILVIDTAPAKATLSDGRNAHVSIHDETWWLARLTPAFPSLRPFRIRRRNRVAFKTFDEDLRPMRATCVRGWYWGVVKARRLAAELGLRSPV
ncbi:methyltransferase domain-containing protein [Chthonobacter rhizosphaerae]|uniref:methyltransferase domain-containing protein n=1 Tax=Chthonobacter rhizosphaerae TaxID=2735553 RepID=UPI0015EF8B5E|nr:methyltransferase domain-containing protein [Chthonobacter rhizosphaerae]